MKSKRKRIKSKVKLIFVSLLALPIAYFGATLAYSAYSINLLKVNVVKVLGGKNKKGMRGGGTGFVVHTKHNHVFTITNAHVCKHNERGYMYAFSQQTQKAYVLRILAVSVSSDLCLMQPINDAPGIELGEEDPVGLRVYVLGHPHLGQLSFDYGTILDYRETNHMPDSSYTSVVVYPGHSGSPMVNQYGYLVGVIYALGVNNYAYVIRLGEVKKFLERYETNACK